jgi:thiol-disulfide isomerase/thioredoxin
MNLVKKGINYVKQMCDDDDVCIMIVFVVIGFMICYLFKNQISGYVNFATVDHEFDPLIDSVGGKGGGAPVDHPPQIMDDKPVQEEKPVGIELKPRKPDPTPSTMKQLGVMAAKPPVENGMIKQKVGLDTQDAMIFRPFDEVWNPGFMPLDMVFKGAKPTQMAPDRPMAPERPMAMKPTGPKPMGPDRPMPPTMGSQAGPQAAEEVSLVLVYAPWCGHSKRMLPDYERIKSEYDGKTVNGKKINILMYDSDVDKDKVKEYGVRGFPSLFFESGGNRESFPHRQYEKIKDFLENL